MTPRAAFSKCRSLLGGDASGSQESSTRLEMAAAHNMIKQGKLRVIAPDQVHRRLFALPDPILSSRRRRKREEANKLDQTAQKVW